ncbi:ABC transporter permease [Pseudoalteromonas sp. JB197]|uniref:ABC transporter permease n=1 Tax=Pseudoalteromonas sp. JB197 TaxID=1434839 RepID=UPI00097F5615|nr:ABC transporter permease [Pseudoalteromonas sp. JB197]PCC14208.1 hypothetical protein CIK86_13695 [Pseudoalteromonas sp. JB197]SJN16457.1 Permease [Pseudoalteromonas sp. JB197]
MNWRYELKCGLQNVLNRPGLSLPVVITLGLAIGTLLSMFALSYLLLVKPLPYPDSEQLHVAVGQRYDGDKLNLNGFYPYPGVELLQKQQTVFESSAILNYAETAILNLTDQPRVFVVHSSAQWFSLVGMAMEIGSAFSTEDEPVAVISHRLWTREFGQRHDILTETVELSGKSYRIVGVAAEDFVEPSIFNTSSVADIWVPWEFNDWNEAFRKDWQSATGALRFVGRLKPDVTAEQASAQLSTVLNERFKQETVGVGFLQNARINIDVQSFKTLIVGDSYRTALMLFAGSISLLFIACVNVGNLLLSRAAENQRRLAIQATVGAGPKQVFGTVLAENLVLVGFSGLFALLVQTVVSSLLRHFTAGVLPRIDELALGAQGLIFALVLTVLLAICFAFIVCRSLDYRKLNGFMQSSGKGTGLQISKTTRNLLVASQIALASVLIFSILNLLNNSIEVISKPSGFATENRIHFTLGSGTQQFSRDERIQYIESVREVLLQQAGVENVSNTLFAPMMTSDWTSLLALNQAGDGRLSPNTNLVDDQYFSIMELPLIKGRNFSSEEVRDTSNNIIVNETLANHLVPGGDVLGKRYYWQNKPDPYTVIGVVRDISIPRSSSTFRVYVTRTTGFNFIVKMQPGQMLNKSQINQLVKQVNGNFSLYSYSNVQDAYDNLLLKDYVVIAITIMLAVMTLLLAALGIFGVLSYGVKLRQNELGIRMAIGAKPNSIIKLVLKDNSVATVMGLFIGMLLAAAVYFFAKEYFDFSLPVYILPTLFTVIVILLTTVLACILPLRAIAFRMPNYSLRRD